MAIFNADTVGLIYAMAEKEQDDVFKREFKRFKKLSPREALDAASIASKQLLLVSKNY